MELKNKLRLCLAILKARKGNLYSHACAELPPVAEDGPDKWIRQNLLDLVTVFSTQGHSGFSAGYCRAALDKLLGFKPIRPLTGEDSEWNEVGKGLWQNRRASHVFKDSAGAYDIDAVVYEYPNGCRYMRGGREGRDTIAFPYTPTQTVVKVDDNGDPIPPTGLPTD